MHYVGEIIGYAAAAVSLLYSVYLGRKNKRLEVNSKEIATADQMIELVKKANAEVLTFNQKENEKLRRTISRLEKAVRSISTCAHRDSCPIPGQLQDDLLGL